MGGKVAFQAAAASPAAPVSAPVRRLVGAAKAVQKAGERNIVWVVKEGRVERRAITLGQAEGDEVGVASGLNVGESVLLNPPPGLKEGSPVKVDS